MPCPCAFPCTSEFTFVYLFTSHFPDMHAEAKFL